MGTANCITLLIKLTLDFQKISDLLLFGCYASQVALRVVVFVADEGFKRPKAREGNLKRKKEKGAMVYWGKGPVNFMSYTYIYICMRGK